MRKRISVPTALLLSLLVSACASTVDYSEFEPADGGPSEVPDLSAVGDAVPRKEARSRYGNPDSYEVYGKTYYVMADSHGYVERGIASWYGTKFHGRRTSSGERYDMYAMTAAHKSLPLPTYARVTNLNNGRAITVKINDRGPFHENRVIDLSYAAAHKLGIAGAGTGLVEIRAIDTDTPPPVVAAATPPSTTTAPASGAGVKLYLQAGAFLSRHNAERLRGELLQLFRHIVISPGAHAQGTVYRVRLGPIGKVEDADRLAEELSRRGIVKPHVVIE